MSQARRGKVQGGNRRNPESKQRKRTGFKVFLFLLLVAIVFTSIHLFLTHPVFAFQKIQIRGNQTLSTAKLESLFQDLRGQNLFRLDTGPYRDQILSQPMVAEVDVKKQYPDSLEVIIREHYPVAYLSVGSQEYPVDETGILHEPGLFTSHKTGNIFLSGEEKKPVPGEFFSEDMGRVDLITSLVKLNLYKKVSNITFGLEETTSLRYNGISVSFGPLENVSYKLSLLDETVQDLNRKGITASEIRMDFEGKAIAVTDESSDHTYKADTIKDDE